jgi:hypothetical protein
MKGSDIDMRSLFSGFYTPTKDEFEALWKEGLIVFDTNALLDLYRLPPKARNEFFAVLEFFKDQLWIPHHVGLEFQRNRLEAINFQKAKTASALLEANQVISGLQGKINSLKLDQHDIAFDPAAALNELDAPIQKLSGAIKLIQKSELEISSDDPIRSRLDALLEGKVGPGPKDKEELEMLVSDAGERYGTKIPPGFADIKRKEGQTFIHNHLEYKNMYGDLIVWRQLINHVKENGIKRVTLVTSDRKEDWWWTVGEKTLGPHHELIGEIKRLAGVDTFWMYKTDNFLRRASTFIGNDVEVSQESLDELSDIVNDVFVSETEHEQRPLGKTQLHQGISAIIDEDIKLSVGEWLQRNRRAVRDESGKFDYIGAHGTRTIRYRIVEVRGREDKTEILNLAEDFAKRRADTTYNEAVQFLGIVFVKHGVGSHYGQDDDLNDFLLGISEAMKKFNVIDILFGYVLFGEFDLRFTRR